MMSREEREKEAERVAHVWRLNQQRIDAEKKKQLDADDNAMCRMGGRYET